ncbi:MAG: hypothetical protein ACLSAC_04385 [Enterocloster bolteae]
MTRIRLTRISYSTCRRADKNMYMKKQQYYEDIINAWEDGDGTVGQAV